MIEFFSKFRQLQRYLFAPNREQIATGNIAFMAFCICTGVLSGSLTSIYLGAGIVFGIWHIARGAVLWQLDRPAVVTAYAFASYFFAELIAYLAHPGGNGATEVLSNLPFLGFLPIYLLLVADRERLKGAIEKTAVFVAIAAGIFAMLTPSTLEARVELGAGNPGITAVLASILLLVNIIRDARAPRFEWNISKLGIIASLVVLLLTGVRSQWPNLVLIPFIVMYIYRYNSALKVTYKTIVSLGIVVIAVTGLVFSTIVPRITAIESDLQEITNRDYSSSLGTRVVLWTEGARLIAQQPLLGYGPGNIVKKIEEIGEGNGTKANSFSHFHNVIINELMRSGILGLAALLSMFLVPLYFVLTSRRSENRKWALALMAGSQATYFLSGTTGIMIGHDILDALHISLTALCLYIVRDDTARERQ